MGAVTTVPRPGQPTTMRDRAPGTGAEKPGCSCAASSSGSDSLSGGRRWPGQQGRVGVSGDVHSPQQHGRGPGPSSGSSSEAVSWQGGSRREFTQPKRPRGKTEHRTFPTFEGLWVCASLAGHPLSLPLLLSPQERAPVQPSLWGPSLCSPTCYGLAWGLFPFSNGSSKIFCLKILFPRKVVLSFGSVGAGGEAGSGGGEANAPVSAPSHP